MLLSFLAPEHMFPPTFKVPHILSEVLGLQGPPLPSPRELPGPDLLCGQPGRTRCSLCSAGGCTSGEERQDYGEQGEDREDVQAGTWVGKLKRTCFFAWKKFFN